MPSGAKKRKAAKKKKENQPTKGSNSSAVSIISRGDEDVKHQEDKGSDVGELSSTASQDHHGHQNHFTEGDEEETQKERNPSVLGSVEGSRINGDKKQTTREENVIKVEREFKIEGESDKKDGSFEHDEASSRSYDGGSSRSSSGNSSGSDDETRRIKSSQATGDNAPIVESVIKQNGEKRVSSVEDKVGTSVAVVDAALERKEEVIVQSVGSTVVISGPKECVTQENDNRSILPYNERKSNAADNGAEHDKDHGVTEPLLVPTPSPAQKTSWKGCCGLFELFSGSGS